MEIVCATFLFDGERKVLLQLRDKKKNIKNPNYWVPPGGHKKKNESHFKCAKREFYEETNFKLKNLSFFETEIDYIKKWSPYRLFIYYSFLYQFKPNIICNEGVALKFFSRSEAKNLNIPLNVLKIWDRMNARLFNDQENP